MDKNRFDGLIALKLVAENQSFKAAAELLNISTPAISRIIAQLEESMGVTLLTRTTRSVRLTNAGAIFLEQVSPAMEQILKAQDFIKTYGEKPSGPLRINTPVIFYQHYLKDFIKKFLIKYPEIQLEIFSDDQATNIFERGFDAGIRADDIIAKDLIAFKLFGPIDFVTVASPNYFKEFGRPMHPKDLLEHNCITLRFGSGSGIYDKWEFEEKGKEFNVKIHGNLILNNSENIRQAALIGQGIVYTEKGCVEEDLKAGRLEIVLNKYKCQSTGFYLYYPHKTQISPALRAFIEFFKEVKQRERLSRK
ncbi:putative LysR family transcriptional regulator [Halobacteriovorax marinus SJ]|uniref:LysR family transcriptional regulator n=1 Tax=Halobacteriovorax marinus (strain ATCC BAA-682 / DSM 15412 / SJ) TaxID=862908 RepID=E1X034_HALMS|nr:LysR family transcriptional regulator [Halobacteriovorax marinus]CBW27970.1 putative LysR family transcriptional regulator [Halobacteriovorax marinus SJ]